MQPKYDRATLVNSRGQKGTVYIPEPCANQITTNDPNQFLPQALAGMQAGFLNPVTKEFTPTTGIQYTGLSSTGQLVQQGVVNPSFTNPVRPGIVQAPQGQFAGQPIGGNVVGVIDPDFSGQRRGFQQGNFQQGFQGGFQPGFVESGIPVEQAVQQLQQSIAEKEFRENRGVDNPRDIKVVTTIPTIEAAVKRQNRVVDVTNPSNTTTSGTGGDVSFEQFETPSNAQELARQNIRRAELARGSEAGGARYATGQRGGIGTTGGNFGTTGGTGGMEDTNPEIWALINNTGAGVPGR